MISKEEGPRPLCESDPDSWSDPEPDSVAYIKNLCVTKCPLLAECRLMSAKYQWQHPVIVAGWQPRKKGPMSGRFPPWRTEPATPREYTRAPFRRK